MKFEEVLPALQEGKKIRKTFWDPDHYIELVGLCFYDNDTYKDYNFYLLDFICNTWEIIEEPLLMENEKTSIKAVLNIAKNTKIKGIKLQCPPHCNKYFLYFMCDESRTLFSFQLTDRAYFKNLKLDTYYTLKELGLDD